MKCGLLSDLKWDGAPKRSKWCSKHSAVDSAVASGGMYNSTTYNYEDISFVRKWVHEVNTWTSHRGICRCRENMSVNGHFQHTHLLTAGALVNEIFDVLSLKLPNIFQILETTKRVIVRSRPKWPTLDLCKLPTFEYWILFGLFDFEIDERLCSSEYSWGESTMFISIETRHSVCDTIVFNRWSGWRRECDEVVTWRTNSEKKNWSMYVIDCG